MTAITPMATIKTHKAISFHTHGRITVHVRWIGAKVDRPITEGWGFSDTDLDLAKRLVVAINDGMVYENPKVMEDIYGKTYIHADTKIGVFGKYLDSELKSIGY